ncbi:MAG: hypothetical protein K2Q33_05160, partial [Gammaproteobacteria bacterium]|nr:hypothetical protein [Gammaproteobacteria bacterium]
MSATGFPELWELESQKETSAAENAALSQLIYKNNSKKALKDMQIVRFGGVAIAIYRPRDAKGIPRGSFGSVYRAYPIIMCNPVDNSLNG